jgi:hypothetical protein
LPTPSRLMTEANCAALGAMHGTGLSTTAPISPHHATNVLLCAAMEIASWKFPPMPGEYCRRQVARVRSLAHDATTLAIREHLADVALQYKKLAEGAEAGYRTTE